MAEVAWPLFGHEQAEMHFVKAFESQRLHHAWLIEGPSGIGKSILAKRISAFMLGAQRSGSDVLDILHNDTVANKISAESHPDLRWLSRRPDEKGKLRQDIPIDEVRALNQFFSLKSGLGGWRVGVIDPIDDLNRNGANALLKTLEEPPPKSLLILISHGTRSLLPTIRSRCTRLRLSILNEEETAKALKQSGANDVRATTKLAKGRPGLGLALTTPAGLAASNAVRSFIRSLPRPSDTLLAQTIRMAGVDTIAFSAFTSELMSWLAQGATERIEYGDAWLAMSRTVANVRELNMDPTQAASKMVAQLQSIAQTN